MSGRLDGVLPIAGSAERSRFHQATVRLATPGTAGTTAPNRLASTRSGNGAGGGGGTPVPGRPATASAPATVAASVRTRQTLTESAGGWGLRSAMSTPNRPATSGD